MMKWSSRSLPGFTKDVVVIVIGDALKLVAVHDGATHARSKNNETLLLQKFSCSQCQAIRSQESVKITNMKKQHLIVAPFLSFLPSLFIIWLNPIIIIKRKWWWWLIVDDVMTWCCSYSRQSASSKQSVLTQPRSGFGEVRPWRSKRVNQKCSMLSWEKSMINCMYLAQVRDKQGCSLLWDRFSTPLVTIEETFWKNAT